MKYLNTKPGSIEEIAAKMQSSIKEDEYQKLFKKELDKAGKGIGSMSPAEKKDFFNKIDKMYKGKNEAKVDELTAGQKKLPPALQKAIKDKEDKKESVEETHMSTTKDMNQSKKDAKGEKEIVDPEPKLKQESIQDAIANVWKMSAEELEKIKTEAKYMKAQRMSQYKAEDEKNKKGTADTGSKATKIDVEPKVDYKN